MRLLLGIDLGTSGLKAVVFDLDGNPLGKGLTANEYVTGPAGWAEQDPRMWWAGCCKAILSALAESRAHPGNIAGIGVCGFHHIPVFLNAEGEPTRPSIVTHDQRLGDSLEDLRRSGILDQVVGLSGSRVMTGHFPTIYHYLLKNDQGALEEARWILLAKDYLRFKLTGKIGTEACDATGTNLIAMPGQEWSESLCQLLQVPLEKLPPIGASSQVFGCVTQQAAQATGLQAGTPVVYGGGDSHCALVGLGVIGSGEVGMLLGTNSTLRASFGSFVPDLEHSVWAQQHVVPGTYTVSASSMAGSSVLSWYKKTCFAATAESVPLRCASGIAILRRAGWEDPRSQDQEATYHELESLAAGVPPGCDGLLFHPYLFGERSPFNNPKARGAFLAVTHGHHQGHFVRSILEGVAFCIANCFETVHAIANERGEPIRTVRIADSGGTRLRLWRQIITDALPAPLAGSPGGFPLEVVCVEEPGCLGAALLAGVGVGQYEGISSAVEQTVRVGSQIVPDMAVSALYQERRTLFNAAYRALESILY